MTLIKKNIVANLVGSGWAALISVAFIPLYIHFLGVEAYGLIGFYLTLQALFSVLDMGLTATVSRELARLSALENKARDMRDLVRTLEIIYWMIAIVIIFVVILIAPWIATKWLNANKLSIETIQQVIVLMGLIVALRMPYGFYGGGILGLQRQVLLNGIKIGIETLKSGGAVLILWLVSPTIISFFLWQTTVAVFGACLITIAMWRSLPENFANIPSFQPVIIRKLWRFAAGMSAITVLSVILVQMDKVVLSNMLSLDEFAYYSLASTVSLGLYVIIGSMFSAIYPHFTGLVAKQDEVILKELYHKSCQMMTVLVIPPALVVSFFSFQIMQLWTQNEVITEHTAPILSVLVIGNALNGMMNLPFALQLAHGWTRLGIGMNMIAIIVLLPMLIIAVESYGSLGAAVIWLLLNVSYIVFGMVLMHRKLFKSELSQWIVTDFGLPSLASLGVVACFWLALPERLGLIGQLFWVSMACLVAWGVSSWMAPAIRHDLLRRVRIWK